MTSIVLASPDLPVDGQAFARALRIAGPGLEVRCACDGRQALAEVLRPDRDPPRLLAVDPVLPGAWSTREVVGTLERVLAGREVPVYLLLDEVADFPPGIPLTRVAGILLRGALLETLRSALGWPEPAVERPRAVSA